MFRHVDEAPTTKTLAEELRSTQRGMPYNSVPTLLARSVAQGERASSFRKEVVESFASSTDDFVTGASGRQTHLN